MAEDTSKPLLSDAEFRLFSSLLRERSGLHFDEGTRYLLERRIARRIAETDSGSFASYLHQLRRGAGAEEELASLIDRLTTHETYFFRDRSPLEALVREIVPELRLRAEGASRPVQIWSAGCATGEEPYSVVMLGLEAGLVPGRDFQVVASDISRTVLARARTGLYRDVSFRDADELLWARYFSRKDGVSKISDEVRRHVDFMHLNLVDEAKLALLGTMDVILCRNVIIYFDLATRRRVMKSFHDKLRPGGCLLLGHSESLADVTTAFELKHLKRDLVYRRPVLGEEPDDVWHAVARAALEAAD
ncbi:protein-glutamate O-methyltransferase CheR [Myxococcota bacterium]|nr:protein-glutamate O-methyltransferase CheR [Myxococcota bacterium]